jgi:hypothetical protein
VVGRLAIPELGTRAGIGAHPLDAGAGEDAAYKSAESDAFKRAAMAFGVGLEQLYVQTGEAKRLQSQRSAKRPMPTPPRPDRAWQTDWQARIDRALAQPDETGKQAWQLIVHEAIELRSEERLVVLIRNARTADAAKAIVRHAERHGVAGRLIADALTARTRDAGRA